MPRFSKLIACIGHDGTYLNVFLGAYASDIFSYIIYISHKNIATLKCLSIGTPKTINFPFVSNGKLIVFRRLNIQAHYNEAVIYLNFGTPKNNEFSIWNKWKIHYF